MNAFPIEKIERLIRISKANPMLPASFIPWKDKPKEDDIFLPESLVSLAGHPLFDSLTPVQQKELGRHEVVQVMFSYAWSETLACLFFTRHLLTLDNTSAEYRFLLREIIEEFQHQEMFSSVVIKLDGKPIQPGFQHRFWGKLSAKYMPADCVFMSVLAVELIADTYGKKIRQDKRVFNVLRKVSELHNIEEGRHIHYTKMWLKRYTEKAGRIKRSMYGIIVMLNVYFMRTLYVKKEIFERIGVSDAQKYQRAAYTHYRQKFADECLDEAVEFTQSIGGFNRFTKWCWKKVLSVDVNKFLKK